ncbi:MAG: MBL fold metallo-hydrolase [Evtepia sp.]
MIIKQLQVGEIGTNCYIFGDETKGVCAVVDPGGNADRIAQVITDMGMELQYILLTHGHFDHVLGLPALRKVFPNAAVWIHRDEVAGDHPQDRHMKLPMQKDLHFYDEGDSLLLGTLTIHVLHTPGHSPGSVVLQVEDVLFCGDTLFCGSCGRTDFVGGSYPRILQSLRRLAELPGDFRVYPGHESSTTLERERHQNGYVMEALSR